MTPVTVFGAGAFGTALAISLARDGRKVTLVARDRTHATDMAATRENAARLPGFTFPESLAPAAASETSDTICLIAVPTQKLADFVAENSASLASRDLVACCKGVDLATGHGPTRVIADAVPDARPAILSGPSFAVDIAAGLPTALTIAAEDADRAAALQHALSTGNLRFYRSTDVVGVELGGALKNIVAIAAGVAIGAGLGESARASVITRGYAELRRFAESMGCSSRHAVRAFRVWRSRSDLHVREIPQLRIRVGHRRRTAPCSGRHRRRRGDGARGDGSGEIPRNRHAFDANGRGAGIRTTNGRRGRRAALVATPERGMNMRYWLFKSEASTWSWDQQVAKGEAGEQWDGVRNYQARNNMREMKLGDRGLFYHSQDEKAVVGIVEVCAEAHPDSTTEDPRWECVDIKAVKPMPKPVTLAMCKAEPRLSEMVLVNNSRLSVQPVSEDEWKVVCELGEL